MGIDDSQERRVTASELQELRKWIEGGFSHLRVEIREARTEAVQAHDRMRNDWTMLLKDSIEQRGRVDRIERDIHDAEVARVTKEKEDADAARSAAREAAEARRWLWAQVVSVAALVAGVFAWAIDKLGGRHP